MQKSQKIRIYSVGVWNSCSGEIAIGAPVLEFTPLEFETLYSESDAQSGQY